MGKDTSVQALLRGCCELIVGMGLDTAYIRNGGCACIAGEGTEAGSGGGGEGLQQDKGSNVSDNLEPRIPHHSA
jgi:hypothetical protein